ncbi:MAG: class II aldolase/adducin family protein [Rhizobacter sp.]|nr:class II aldolase/adducin family protein [Rhizobacter sp.]
MNAPLEFASLRNQVSAEEWQTRVDLAAAYRLVALFGWDDLVFTHISARVPGEDGNFLINPYGLFFEEITASSLVKVDHHGAKVMPSKYDINPAGFVIHSAVHEARPEVACVLHTHTLHGVAVSAQKRGLLALSQHSTFPLNSLAYHDYEGVALRDDEKPRLVNSLGRANSLILRNHGLLTCGRTIAEAFGAMYQLETSCRMQILAQSGGVELNELPQSMIDLNREQSKAATNGKGVSLVWPGLLRRLDRRNPGYDA